MEREYEDVRGALKNRLGQGVKGTATEYAANVVDTFCKAYRTT